MRDFVVLVSLDDAACRAMARKLRAEHVYCRILPSTATADDILRMDARGILLASGATGYAAELPQMMDYLQSGLPMLCMGDAALTLCQTLGGTLLDRAQDSSVVPVTFLQEDPVLSGVEDGERFIPALRYIDMGDMQGSVVARSEEGVLGFRASQRDVWGLAFPLEKHDVGGIQLLTNFCRDVCGCSLWWSNQAFVERAKESISEAAEGGEALCALSGGVDSGVCALLGHQALGERLHCIFVDTGLLRQDEAEQVMDFYGGQMGLKVKRIDASQEFLTALSGVRNPEEKEHIVHTLLRDILLREAAAIEGIRLM
ncbi:MAG: hypothetical protein IJ418_14510, partial [Clostridia bacterium]|nr:hypothetical protein [Clostridia bacterium]